MHFYGWESGLKTGMYYLRSKAATDPIKFTLGQKHQQKFVANAKVSEPVISMTAETAAAATPHTMSALEPDPDCAAGGRAYCGHVLRYR